MKNVIKSLVILSILGLAFFYLPRLSQAETTYKCTCVASATYSACGTYFGQTNVKYRRCTYNTSGSSNCIKRKEDEKNRYYEVVSCVTPTTNPLTPTIVPGAAGAACNLSVQPQRPCADGLICQPPTTVTGSLSGTQQGIDGVCVVAPPTPTIDPSASPTPTKTPDDLLPFLEFDDIKSAKVTPGTVDLCKSVTVSTTSIDNGEYIVIRAIANNSSITKFWYRFINKDHLVSGKPTDIVFPPHNPFTIIRNKSVTDNNDVIKLGFGIFNRKDTSWNYYMPRPKDIRLEVYFTDMNGKTSKLNEDCVKTFKVKSVDPTPTPNVNCKCVNGACATACFFDKYPAGITYANPMKCNLPNNNFKSDPSANNKNDWCQAYLRPRGDANSDGKVTLMDYFYLISVRSGAKVSPKIYVDFDGDNLVSPKDRDVIIKTLK